VAQISDWLRELAGLQENDVFSRLLDDKMRAEKDAKNHAVTIMTAFKPQFEQLWAEEDKRLALCPPKQLISGLNAKLQANGFKATSIVAIARAHKVSEVPEEVSALLNAIELAVS
jgi:hypothetical protein